MTFQDLDAYDLDLIRSMAVTLLSVTKIYDRYEALMVTTFECIHAKGFNFSKEADSRTILKAIKPKPVMRGIPSEKSFEDIIEDTFTELKNMNINLVKDEIRQSTWSRPNESWYTKSDNKKPWTY